MPVPISTLPSIIGKQGSRIQELQKSTGARINVNKSSQRPANLDEDDLVDVEIQGNSVTTALAEQEIQAIVRERTSNVNLRLRDIPPELFPFLSGPHGQHIGAFEDGRGVRVNIPHYHTWDEQPPPQAIGSNQPISFKPQDGYHILVSGEREAAQQVQAEIQRRALELQRTLTTSQLDVEREKHRFILGESASSLHDFLQETNCSIILPPSSGESETLTVVGPPEHVDAAVNKVMDLALSMAMTSVDISRQHPNAPRSAQVHARDVARYLQQREALSRLEQLHEANIVVPDGASPWQIYSRDGKNGMRARKDIADLVGAQIPARYRTLDNVHPFYQQHLQQEHAQLVRDQYGVHLIVAEPEMEQTPLLMVYEGPGDIGSYDFPRSKPTPEEMTAFEQSLAAAEQYITGLIEGQGEIVHGTVDAPSKYTEKLQKYAQRQLEQQSGAGFPVRFLGPTDLESRPTRGDTVPLAFQGPSNEVDRYRQSLLDFIEEQIRDEAERGYVTSCDYPQKFVSQLVGRRGENINKLRDEFDVEIRVGEGKVDIQGPKAKADAAKAHIISFARKQEDETTHTLKIKPQFHGELIGLRGSQIRRLQDRYNVRINFPHTGGASPDTQSIADGGNDVGASTKNRRPQGADEVIIKGPKRGADDARNEILDLYQYMQDHAHVATVSVAYSQLPSLIGQGGRELDKLRLETGAQIDVPPLRDSKDPSGRAEVKLRGTQEQVNKARQEVAKRAKLFDQSITKTLDVDKKYHRSLIGRNGETLRAMVVQAGGSEDERNRLVRFPPVGSQENAIKLEGQQDVVEKLASAIQAFVTERDQQITENVTVAPDRHGALIGSGGETRRRLESEYKITLNVPDRSATGVARSQVKLTGLPANVEKAKEAITAMTRGPENKTVHVPRHLHHHVYGSHGSKLRDMGIRIDHGGHSRPSRPAPPANKMNGAGSAMPLITDSFEPSAMDIREHHGWSTLDSAATADDPDASIPWIMRATEAEEIARAEEMILAAIAAEQEMCTGYLTLPDPSFNQYVIGPHGSTINAVRNETGCRIDVPKRPVGAEPIEIRGPLAAVEQAKDMILAAVDEGRRR